MLCCNWLVFNRCDWRISILAVSVNRSLGVPLSYGSPVVVFLDRGYPCFWNFYSTVPVDVVRVKSYLNRLFDPVSGWCPVLWACSETAEVWVRANWTSRSCSLILSSMGLPVSPM